MINTQINSLGQTTRQSQAAEYQARSLSSNLLPSEPSSRSPGQRSAAFLGDFQQRPTLLMSIFSLQRMFPGIGSIHLSLASQGIPGSTNSSLAAGTSESVPSVLHLGLRTTKRKFQLITRKLNKATKQCQVCKADENQEAETYCVTALLE